MMQRKYILLLSLTTIAVAYLSYRELSARGGFVSGMMVGVLLAGLMLAWWEMLTAKKA